MLLNNFKVLIVIALLSYIIYFKYFNPYKCDILSAKKGHCKLYKNFGI